MEKPTYTTFYTASDLLSAWGSVLAFLGTVVLGYVAMYQNYKFQEFNKKVYVQEKRNTEKPLLELVGIQCTTDKALQFEQDEAIYHANQCPKDFSRKTFTCIIKNAGNGTAKNIRMHSDFCNGAVIKNTAKVGEEIKIIVTIGEIGYDNDFFCNGISVSYDNVYEFSYYNSLLFLSISNNDVFNMSVFLYEQRYKD